MNLNAAAVSEEFTPRIARLYPWGLLIGLASRLALRASFLPCLIIPGRTLGARRLALRRRRGWPVGPDHGPARLLLRRR